jgi:hypothetical protein
MRHLTAVCALVVLLVTSMSRGQGIDFTPLVGADAADADGQNLVWQFGAESGSVNLKSTYDGIFAVDGGLRMPFQAPGSFQNPFQGTVTLTFDRPVEIAVLATFASLLRDGLSGGRFEQVRLSSPGSVTFAPAPNTTAVYSGVGTNSILADDEFSPTPTVSIWGFVGSGAATTYQIQYTGTSGGLSETFVVVPEPSSVALGIVAAIAGCWFVLRRRPAS